MMLIIVLLSLLFVIASSPRFLPESTVGVFMERLSAELGTAVAHVSRFGVAALHYDGCQAVELRDLVGALEAVSVSAKGDQQTRRQRRAGPRKTAKNNCIRVLVHRVLNLFVQPSYGLVQGFEHAGQCDDQQTSGHDDRRISGQSFGALQGGQALLDLFGAT